MERFLIKKRPLSQLSLPTCSSEEAIEKEEYDSNKRKKTITNCIQLNKSSLRWIIDNNEARISYISSFLSQKEAIRLYEKLRDEVNWTQPLFELYPGREVAPPRRIAICRLSEQDLSQEKDSLKWQEELYRIRNKISKVTNQQKYNFAVLNYYRDGRDYIGAHSDNEREYEPGTIIASLSLGSERDFVLQHKSTNSKTTIVLENGSLLLMGGECQKYYKHSVPKRLKVTNGRINITFRFIKREEKSSIY